MNPNSSDSNKRSKTLGGKRRFKPVMPQETSSEAPAAGAAEMDERLQHLDPKLVALIESDMMTKTPGTTWDDIAGLGRCLDSDGVKD